MLLMYQTIAKASRSKVAINMTGTDTEKLLLAVDTNLKQKAGSKYDASNLRRAYMYGVLREACYLHMSTGEELHTILRRL